MASRKGIQSLCSTTSLLPPNMSPQLLLKPSSASRDMSLRQKPH